MAKKPKEISKKKIIKKKIKRAFRPKNIGGALIALATLALLATSILPYLI
jgi:hypothetical protein